MGTFKLKDSGQTVTYNPNPERARPNVEAITQQPSFLERVGNTVTGGLKSTASGFANTGGTLLDLLRSYDTAGSSFTRRSNQEAENANHYREMLERGTLDDGTVIDAEMRARLENLAGRADTRSTQYAAAAQTQHAPITRATERVYETADQLAESSERYIQEAKEGLGTVGQAAVDIGAAGVQLGGDILLGALTGTALAPMAVRSFGSGAQEARQEGATLGQQVAYGAGSAALGVATEKIANVAAPLRRAFGSGVLDTAISRATGRLGQSVAGQTVLSALSEGSEEVVEALVQPVLQRITYDEDALQQYQNPDLLADALYQGLIGGALGGIAGGVGGVVNNRRTQTTNGSTQQATESAQAETEPVSTTQSQRAAQGVTSDSEPTLVIRVRQSIPQIQSMSPVAEVTGGEIPQSGRLVERLASFVNSIGNRVNRPGFGDVLFSRGRIKSSMIGHGAGPSKIETFAAVPEVIRNGQQIDYQQNWKGRGYDTYTFAAPITYRGQPTYLGVIVTKDSASNRYYLHEVVDANGDVIFRNDESPASTPDGTSSLAGDLDTVVDTGDGAGTTPGTVDTVTDGRASQGVPASNITIAPGTENVNATDPLVQILTGGRRVDQSTLSNDQFAALADRGDVGLDAGGRVYQVDPAQHIDQRGAEAISDRRVNAFQYDHPELQPYYREAAETLLRELNGSVRGGQTESATGEYGQTYSWRTRRNTSDRIAGLLDGGMSYARIEAALDAIIHDKGRENNADAKRVEAVLDDMLSNGYRGDDRFVPANENYIQAKDAIPGAVERQAETLPDMEDGLGAANAGSLNTAYDRLQAQSSRFYPEGANTARPVDVPMEDFQGRPISRSASTVMGAQAIPDDVIPQIEQMIADGRLSYQRNTDEASLNRATQRVQEKGFDGALEEFRAAVNQGRISKDITTLGQTLLNTAANNRDGNAMAELLSLYQTISTNTGQAMQAMSILRKLSPESQLYGIRKMVDNLNNKLIQKVNREYSDIQIDPELVTRFLEQTDQAGRDAVMQEIYQNVADQVPSSWQDKWNAWRYLAMLGNPRTHVRNVVGNVGFQPLRWVKNEVAAGIESALSAAGVEMERTKSFGASPSLYRAAWRDYENVADILGGNKYDDVVSQVNDRRRIFSNRVLEAARKANTAAMTAEDVIFKRITYADSLAGYLKSNGVTAAQLESGDVDSALLQRARDYAGQEALRATYQDRNAISNRVDRLVRDAGVVGDAILPFRRTPANILARGLEYSPAGLVRGLWDAARNVQNGNKTAAQAIDEIAAGLTGSGLMALGALAFASGAVTTAQGDDKDDEWAELLGHQGYALELPDGTSITLDWLAPESMPFFMGVELMSSMGESGMDANAVVDALKSIANPMLELSMLQSVNDLIDSVQYAEDAPLQAMIPSAIISYFTQAIPTLGGQIERSAEENRMSTYTDRNSSIPTDVQYALGRASSRIPGWDYQQTPYIDAWGRTESSGDPLVRALNNFLNPAYTSQVDIDAVEEELQRVRDATGDTAVFPSSAERYITVNGERKDLTAEEYQAYATTLGQTRYNLVSEGMELPEYRSMSDGEKAEYIGKLYDYASALAKSEVADGYQMETWQQYARTAPAELGFSTAEYIAYYQQYGSNVMSGNGYDKMKQAVEAGLTIEQYADMRDGVDTDGNGYKSQTEARAYLDSHDFTRDQKADLWTIINKSWENSNPYA